VIVAAFQGSPARAHLHVSQSRFGVDRNVPVAAKDGRVPCPTVARNPEWHLRPPSKAGREVGSELGQQRQLGSVTNRLAGRIDAQWEVQPQHRCEHHQGFEWDPWSLAQLDTADLRVRDPDGGAYLSLSQAWAEPCLAQFFASDLQRSSSEPPPSIAEVLTADHRMRMTVMPYPPITRRARRGVKTRRARRTGPCTWGVQQRRSTHAVRAILRNWYASRASET
jgi:hypothetical protein